MFFPRLGAEHHAAAETLGKFGSAAKSALPALRKLLKDKEKMVQRSAREASKAIEGR